MKTNNYKRGHLTAKEISQWLVEGPEQPASQHVENCWACQAKLTEAQEPLAAFRTAVVEWSEAQAARPFSLEAPETRNEGHWGLGLWLPAVSFALAVLLMLGYAKVPALLHGPSAAQPTVATASITTDFDEALLDQVDTEVSEAVPDAMAPLADLVAWDSAEEASTKTAAAEKHAARETSTKPVSTKAQAHAEN